MEAWDQEQQFGEDVASSKNNASVDAENLSEKSSSKHCRKLNSDSDHDLCDSNSTMNARNSNSSSAKGNEMVAAVVMNNCVGRKDHLYFEGEIKQKDIKSCNDEKRKASRLVASETETRSQSPCAEINDQNKRPALICNFYAKGWCIKGSSCRFLHAKDDPQREGDSAADYKVEVQLEGLRETTQRSRSPSFHDGITPSFEDNSAFPLDLSSKRIKLLEHVESKGYHNFSEMPKFPSLQREATFPLSFKDIGTERSQNRSSKDYIDHASLTNRDGSLFKNSFRPEYAIPLSGHIISSSNYHFMNPSSHSRIIESPQTSHSPNSSSSTSLLTSGVLSSNRFSAWTESSLPFSYSTLNPTSLGSRSSFLLQCSSHFSGSEPDNLPSIKRTVSSNDWEPSVPFRPSFLVRSLMSSTGSQYDPLCDSVELPKSGDISFKASFYSQGSSIVNTLHKQNNGDAVSETPDLARNDDTKSVSSHNTNHGNMLDKNCRTQGKDMQIIELEVVGTSSGWQHETMPKQKNSLASSDVKDITEATSGDRRHRQRHGLKDILDVKANRIRQNNEMVVADMVEGVVHKESKALWQFRAALIDFVKELLKPKWREGLLSKDLHNKIVKKAVEKVLGTLQPEQIPPSMELVKQYLASSRPKIDKLVEGYAEIYGKL